MVALDRIAAAHKMNQLYSLRGANVHSLGPHESVSITKQHLDRFIRFCKSRGCQW